MNVIPPQHRREFARRAKRLFRILSGGMRRLSRFAKHLPQVLKEFRETPSGAFRPLASGITSPIGIVAILILTILTVGVPNWGLNKNSWPYYTFLASGILFSVLLWKISRKRYSANFADIFGWLPVSLGTLSYIFWYWYANGGPVAGDNFFHAAAEVLPVLLLATIVDIRRTSYLEGKQLVLPIAAVFLGELAALNVLAFGNARPADFAAVASSFVVAIVALVLAVMADLAPADEHETVKAAEAGTKDQIRSSRPHLTQPPPVTNPSATELTEDLQHAVQEAPQPDPKHRSSER
jgi:hypothetical protein